MKCLVCGFHKATCPHNRCGVDCAECDPDAYRKARVEAKRVYPDGTPRPLWGEDEPDFMEDDNG